jgi:hypothetical protein
MQADDQVAEWLVRWEEARAANLLPPRAREGLRLLRDFARIGHGLTTTAPAPRSDAPPVPPDTPRYCFEAFLARGGMGEVWRARDTLLARAVALKVLREQVFGDGGPESDARAIAHRRQSLVLRAEGDRPHLPGAALSGEQLLPGGGVADANDLFPVPAVSDV